MRLIAVLLGSATLLGATAAMAKEFPPGYLRVCDASRCEPIAGRAEARAFSAFYYGAGHPSAVAAPRAGTPSFELRFKDGLPAGRVGGARLGRTLVYGLNCGRFRRGVWYRLPARAAAALRKASAGLRPIRTSRPVPRSC